MTIFQETKASLQAKAKNGNIHESVVYTEISKLFSEVEELQAENKKLKGQNELYRSLQGITSFVFMDGMADRGSMTDEEFEIVNHHNELCKGQLQNIDGEICFVISKPNTREISGQLDAMEFPEIHKLQDARENLIKAIGGFSAQYEDKGSKFNELKMQIAIMHMLTDEFKKNTNGSASAEDRH